MDATWNDKAYPFRGNFRVEREVNHGHSAVWKVAPTSLNLRISGSNLRLDGIEVPETSELSCELGVGSKQPVAVTFPAGQSLAVPSGNDYHIHASVFGRRSKHYCRLTLQSTQSTDPCVPLSTPPAQSPTSYHPTFVQMVVDASVPSPFVTVDGAPFYPENGVLQFPLHPNGLSFPLLRCSGRPLQEAQRVQLIFEGESRDIGEPVVVDGSGKTVPLLAGSPVELSTSSAFYRLQLPFKQSASAHAAQVEVHFAKDSNNPSAMSMTIITSASYNIAVDANGNRATGIGKCSVSIDGSRPLTVTITVTEPLQYTTIFRQTLHFPVMAVQPTITARPVDIRFEDNKQSPTSRILYVSPEATVSVDGQPATPAASGVALDCTMPRVVSVIRQGSNGRQDCIANLHVGARGGTPEPDNSGWVDQLAALLENPYNPSEVLSKLAALKPPSHSAARVIDGVAKLLRRQAPSLSLKVAQNGTMLTDLSCPGYNVDAAYGTGPRCRLAPGTSLQVQHDTPTSLSAVDALGNVASTVVVDVAAFASPESRLIDSMLNAVKFAKSPEEAGADLKKLVPTGVLQGDALIPELVKHMRNPIPAPTDDLCAQFILSMLTAARQSSQPGEAARRLETLAPSRVNNGDALLFECVRLMKGSPPEVSGPMTMVVSGAPNATLLIDGVEQSVATGQSIMIPRKTQSIMVSVLSSSLQPPSLTSPYIGSLLEWHSLKDPQLLSSRWERVHPQSSQEHQLHGVLLALARQLDSVSPYVKELVAAHALPEPKSLYLRWMGKCRPRDSTEEELHKILLGLAKSSETIPIFSFKTASRQLRNIECDHYSLSALIDDLAMPTPIARGSNLPPSAPFADEFNHKLSVVARDEKGIPKAEIRVELAAGGPSTERAPAVPLTQANYLDVSFQNGSANTSAELTQVVIRAPPGLQVKCDVDHDKCIASPTNEAVVWLESSKPHALKATLTDGLGAVLFQQRLTVPPLMAPRWDIGLVKNRVVVRPERSPSLMATTISIDAQPERIADSIQIPLDQDVGHDVVLRRYYGDKRDLAGEVQLRVGSFVDADDVAEATRAVQGLQPPPNENVAMDQLRMLRDRTLSGVFRGLIDGIIRGLGSRSQLTHPSSEPRAAPSIFFRLRGDEGSADND